MEHVTDVRSEEEQEPATSSFENDEMGEEKKGVTSDDLFIFTCGKNESKFQKYRIRWSMNVF